MHTSHKKIAKTLYHVLFLCLAFFPLSRLAKTMDIKSALSSGINDNHEKKK